MATGGKSKRTRFHARWRIDQDYLAKLAPEDRAWVEKFNDEYYRADFKGEPLHPPGELRRDVYAAQNAAARDIVTAAKDEVIKAVTSKVANRPSLRVRFCMAEDYQMLAKPKEASAIEDDLLQSLERESQEADLVEIFSRPLKSTG